MNKLKITAVIPIRKGSERVPNKNIRPFGNTSLLELKINTLKKVKSVDEIIVNTDSEEAIEVAKELKVGYHRREAFYASSECPANEYFYYLGKTTESDIIAYTPVTSPFIKKETLSALIKSFNVNENYSIVTAGGLKEFLWKGNQPLNFKLDKHPKSQDLGGIYAINFGLCLISRKQLLDSKSIIGPNPKIVEVSTIESIDIDTPLDFFIAEQIYIRTIMEQKPLIN